jgi:glycoside/pentoside/hexuronide:cation symporter, GPH family
MTAAEVLSAPARPLWPWSVFAALIASAGLPIYIHAPKFFADSYGVSLTALGLTLGLLRFVDVVQDPLLGWFAETLGRSRRYWVAGAAILMALAMFGLFAVPPPIAPIWWFAVTLTALFTAFSFLTILFYAEGVAKADRMGPTGHVRLAGWREAGSLLGVSLAAVAPTLLAMATPTPFAAFSVGFAALALLAVVMMNGEWRYLDDRPRPPTSAFSGFARFRPALADRITRRLLILAFLNSAPVAVTSTLFLLFVESRLGAPGAEGPYLLLFFLSAAVSTLGWSRLAQGIGPKPTLLAGMILSILAFLWAATLGTGATLAFGVVCIASGAALGADMTLLPAIFARRLAMIGQGGEAAAFALWSFVSKLSLAVAAATLLPLLDRFGFVPGTSNDASALSALSTLYALLPCALKLAAIGFLAAVPVPKE